MASLSAALDKVLLDDHLPPEGSSSSLMTSSTSRISGAYDLASLILFGTSALPVKLKILLDALLSCFSEGERIQLLQGFGWTLQDFSRGYILKVTFTPTISLLRVVVKRERFLHVPLFLFWTLHFPVLSSMTSFLSCLSMNASLNSPRLWLLMAEPTVVSRFRVIT
jgi:hypothetical protein